MWKLGLMVMVVGLSGCSEEAFEDCNLDNLTGTWRTTYQEVDGDCGPIPDNTLAVMPNPPVPAGCTLHSKTLATDRCKLETDLECPTDDGQGTVRTTSVSEHVAAETISGTNTTTLTHPSGSCRSTYNVTVRKL